MFNEAINEKNVRKPYLDIMNWANSLPKNIIAKKKIEAEELFKKIGITFSVYNNFDTSERLIPFDFFPRIITSLEWLKIEKGIKQRAIAINAFLNDIYHRGEIIKANIIPTKLIYNNPSYEVKIEFALSVILKKIFLPDDFIKLSFSTRPPNRNLIFSDILWSKTWVGDL